MLNVNAANFENIALEVFRFQHQHNVVYRQYCDALRIDPAFVTGVGSIPFLPVSFFKTHTIICGQASAPELVFESSGTTGSVASRHYITDAAIYEQSLLMGFRQFYGPPADYAVLALLPSYLERQNASLVYMAKTLMRESGHACNGFYINEWDKLSATLRSLELAGQKTLLLGVTFALLDFAAAHPMALRNTIVMETGGMKGRGEELTRDEVHLVLKKNLGLDNIHSEYGMTELLSQAYAPAAGIFRCTATMRALIRDINDPLEVTEQGTGAINIIDLANLNSCSFIATEDIGRLAPDGSFEVLGRLDHSALRGCSLMAV